VRYEVAAPHQATICARPGRPGGPRRAGPAPVGAAQVSGHDSVMEPHRVLCCACNGVMSRRWKYRRIRVQRRDRAGGVLREYCLVA
jgi:hypothetical protein